MQRPPSALISSKGEHGALRRAGPLLCLSSLSFCFCICKMKRLDQTIPKSLPGAALSSDVLYSCPCRVVMEGSWEGQEYILNRFKRVNGLQVTEKTASCRGMAMW